MTQKDQPSPVIRLLDLVWSEAEGATSKSNERFNHAMSEALRLAIGAGLKFQDGDFKHIAGHYGAGRWIGASTESFYSQAVREGNYSAATSYEIWQKRPALIADNVDAGSGDHFAHMAGTRKRERLHVGCQFPWQGDQVKVTSFSEDKLTGQPCVVACTYHDGQESKVKNLHRITRADIVADRAERRERAKFRDAIRDHPKKDKILADLKCKRQSEFEELPLQQVRDVLQKYLEKDLWNKLAATGGVKLEPEEEDEAA